MHMTQTVFPLSGVTAALIRDNMQRNGPWRQVRCGYFEVRLSQISRSNLKVAMKSLARGLMTLVDMPMNL